MADSARNVLAYQVAFVFSNILKVNPSSTKASQLKENKSRGGAAYDRVLRATLKVAGVTLGTIFHLAKQGGHSSQPLAAMSAAQPIQLLPLFDIKEAKVDRFLQKPPPPRRWLLHDTLPLGKVGMVVAPGGTGKSFLMIQLAVAVATQTLLANYWTVDSPGASLILCAEEDDDDLHHRLQDVIAATVGQDPTMPALIKQRIFIKSMITENNLMTHSNERREIVLTDYVDRLALTARGIPDLKLIIIDPASRFRGGDENAAHDTTRFVEALERLRSATDATVLLVHHASKGSMNADEVDQGASRGSSALSDGVRWQMSLSKPSKLTAKKLGIMEPDRYQYVMATITKSNGAPPQPPVLLKRGPKGVLVATQAQTKKPVSPEMRMLGKIHWETAGGKTYTANSFEQKFGGATKELQLSVVAIRKLIVACINAGYLRKSTAKPIGVLELTGIIPP